jgi:hypothetical protein
MNIIRSIILVVIVLLGAVAPMSGKNQLIFQTGDCDEGGTWWSVSEWDGGQLIQLWGLDCSGKYYYKVVPSQWNIVAADPTGSATPLITGDCDAGMVWKAVLVYDNNRRVVNAGGQFCDGVYWTTAFDYSTGDGWGDAPPVPGVR